MTRTTIVNDMKCKFGQSGFLTKSEIRRYLGVGKNYDLGDLLIGAEPVRISGRVKYHVADIAENLKERRRA